MEFGSNHVIHRIGAKIRELRKSKSLRLVQLAEQVGISTALLSKIENGRIIPTIPKLMDLTRALDIQLHDFFTEINGDDKFSGYVLIRRENFAPYVKEESAKGFDYRSILEYPFKEDVNSFQISIVTLEPGNSRPKVSTNAYEFLFLISGEIKYHLSDQVLSLRSGDALFFDGRLPHVPLNQQTNQAVYLVIYFFLNPEDEDLG
jgi:transcriptional regulator with XRE-family HTH domain